MEAEALLSARLISEDAFRLLLTCCDLASGQLIPDSSARTRGYRQCRSGSYNSFSSAASSSNCWRWSMRIRPFRRRPAKCSRDYSTNVARWLQVSGHSKWRLSLTPGRMKPRAAWQRSLAYDYDFRVADRSDCCRHRLVQKCTAPRGLARAGAATVFHRREDPAWSNHQNRQPGDPQVACPRCHVDGLPSPTME